jgi:hypothetical protein
VRASWRFAAGEGFAAGLVLSLFALKVGAGGRVDTALGDRDPVEGAVELAVAAAVEPVALVLAGVGVERLDASVAGELASDLKQSMDPISQISLDAVSAAQPGSSNSCGASVDLTLSRSNS